MPSVLIYFPNIVLNENTLGADEQFLSFKLFIISYSLRKSFNFLGCLNNSSLYTMVLSSFTAIAVLQSLSD